MLVIACSKQTTDTLKADASGCAKAIPASTYVQVVLAGVAAARGDASSLENLGVQIGEALVVCAAQDLVAIFDAKAGQGSGSAGPSTSQPEPIMIVLKGYVAKHGAAK